MKNKILIYIIPEVQKERIENEREAIPEEKKYFF